MKFNYCALIQGGEGPDVWENDRKISAVDFEDASKQAVAWAKEHRGWVVALEQNDWSEPCKS